MMVLFWSPASAGKTGDKATATPNNAQIKKIVEDVVSALAPKKKWRFQGKGSSGLKEATELQGDRIDIKEDLIDLKECQKKCAAKFDKDDAWNGMVWSDFTSGPCTCVKGDRGHYFGTSNDEHYYHFWME